jgi:hypothetical protein
LTRSNPFHLRSPACSGLRWRACCYNRPAFLIDIKAGAESIVKNVERPAVFPEDKWNADDLSALSSQSSSATSWATLCSVSSCCRASASRRTPPTVRAVLHGQRTA